MVRFFRIVWFKDLCMVLILKLLPGSLYVCQEMIQYITTFEDQLILKFCVSWVNLQYFLFDVELNRSNIQLNCLHFPSNNFILGSHHICLPIFQLKYRRRVFNDTIMYVIYNRSNSWLLAWTFTFCRVQRFFKGFEWKRGLVLMIGSHEENLRTLQDSYVGF